MSCHHFIKEETGSERFKWLPTSMQSQTRLTLAYHSSSATMLDFEIQLNKGQEDILVLFNKHLLSLYPKSDLSTSLPVLCLPGFFKPWF